MRAFFSLSLFLIGLIGLSQNDKTKDLITSIQGQFSASEGVIPYVYYVDAQGTAAELYDRMAYAIMKQGHTVVKKDRDAGYIIFNASFVSVYSTVLSGYLDCQYQVEMSFKDNKAKCLVTLTNYLHRNNKEQTIPIVSKYPFTDSRLEPNFYGIGFYNSHIEVMKLLVSFEKTVKEEKEW
jgi:hypothetical protein